MRRPWRGGWIRGDPSCSWEEGRNKAALLEVWFVGLLAVGRHLLEGAGLRIVSAMGLFTEIIRRRVRTILAGSEGEESDATHNQNGEGFHIEPRILYEHAEKVANEEAG